MYIQHPTKKGGSFGSYVMCSTCPTKTDRAFADTQEGAEDAADRAAHKAGFVRVPKAVRLVAGNTAAVTRWPVYLCAACKVEVAAELARTRPTIFDCGCSHLKVGAGLCDLYNVFGQPRETP